MLHLARRLGSCEYSREILGKGRREGGIPHWRLFGGDPVSSQPFREQPQTKLGVCFSLPKMGWEKIIFFPPYFFRKRMGFSRTFFSSSSAPKSCLFSLSPRSIPNPIFPAFLPEQARQGWGCCDLPQPRSGPSSAPSLCSRDKRGKGALETQPERLQGLGKTFLV